MSYTKRVDIWCDGPECGDWISPEDPTQYVNRARERVAPYGWIYYGGKDYCPYCAEKIKGVQDED